MRLKLDLQPDPYNEKCKVAYTVKPGIQLL
jgi:hypothetical protein